MTITVVDPLFASGTTDSISSAGLITTKARSAYTAWSDNAADTDATVRASILVRQRGSLHPLYPWLWCNEWNCVKDAPVKFTVELGYTSAEYDPNGGDPNPLLQPTEVEYFTVASEEEIDRDYDGNPIVTANQERIFGVKRTFMEQGIRLMRNFTSYSSAAFDTYRDSVNSDTFAGYAPGRLKVMSITAKRATYQAIYYWPVTVEIHSRTPYGTTDLKAWYARPLHEGYNERLFDPFYPGNLAESIISRATDDVNEPMATPIQLNDNGFRVPKDVFTAYHREFKLYGTANYSSMGF